ncbi:Bax inhibitor 1 [Trichuris trichiura]|uniref:Bax inhibitor 1 n=1 Tax=Trichuris trichiura TaxID=36087 RepID=A0A077Z5A5_TRITR|nr:Bax inhibitor 1 [Trichuris trichiura]
MLCCREKPVQTHLRRVYGSLSACMVAAAVGAYVHVAVGSWKGTFWSLLLSVVFLLLINGTQHTRETEKLRFCYLMGFAGLSGLSTGPLLDYIISINPAIIISAFLATATVFVSFTLAALYAPDRKFLYLIGTLLGLLSTMCWLSLFNFFFGFNFLFQVNLYTGLAVMCGFLLYDTQLIMEKRRMGNSDYIRHCVDLFVDFIGIFRRIMIVLAQKEVSLVYVVV